MPYKRGDNLKTAHKTKAEIKAVASKAGKKSGEKRREKRDMRAALKTILDAKFVGRETDVEDVRQALKDAGFTNATNTDALCVRLFSIASNPDEKTADRLKAIEDIHKFVEGETLDLTTKGESLNKQTAFRSVKQAREFMHELDDQY